MVFSSKTQYTEEKDQDNEPDHQTNVKNSKPTLVTVLYFKVNISRSTENSFISILLEIASYNVAPAKTNLPSNMHRPSAKKKHLN